MDPKESHQGQESYSKQLELLAHLLSEETTELSQIRQIIPSPRPERLPLSFALSYLCHSEPCHRSPWHTNKLNLLSFGW